MALEFHQRKDRRLCDRERLRPPSPETITKQAAPGPPDELDQTHGGKPRCLPWHEIVDQQHALPGWIASLCISIRSLPY
jgi:hypothetical protein